MRLLDRLKRFLFGLPREPFTMTATERILLDADIASEAEDHRRELERLDREQPGWDTASRIATAKHALEQGVPRDVVLSVYGEEILRKADPACRREGCGHPLSKHSEKSVVVGEGDAACSVEECDACCSRFIGEDASRCTRCGDWDPQCICYAR